MSIIRIHIDAREVTDSLVKLSMRLDDMTPAMKAITEIINDAVDRAFANEKDPVTGEEWKPLSAPYKARRRAEGSLGSILERSRKLHNALHSEWDTHTATVGVGGHIKYAAIHQHGGTIDRKSGTVKLHFNRRGRFVSGKNKKAHYGMKATYEAYTITIPQRRYLGVNQGDLDEMQASLARYLLGTL